MKLTKRSIDSLPMPEAGQALYWDDELPGYGLRVTKGAKTFIVQRRVAGKSVRVTLGKYGQLTPDQARKLASKNLAELVQGVNINAAKEAEKAQGVILNEAIDAYLTSRQLTAKTLKDYREAQRNAFGDWLRLPIKAISRAMIERRFDEWTKRSQAAANRHFRFLRAVLNFAMEKYSTPDGEPLIPSNPCNRLTALKRWHRIERRTRHLEPHQLKAWFAALEHKPEDSDHRNTVRDFCAFVLLTGCREQEAARLTWKDVDLDAAKVTFQETKNHRTHVLPVGPWLAELLERRQQNRISQFVFPAENQSGHLLNHRKAILAIGADSGVEFRLHDLRRTFASIASVHLERSLSAYTLKRLLNHSSGGDVTSGYVQVGIEDLREPMRQVEDFVLKCAGLKESAPVVKLAVAPTSARAANQSAGLDATR
jgi:integrase